MTKYAYYMPELDGLTKEDAIPLTGVFFNAEHAAEKAAECAYNESGGEMPFEVEYKIVIVEDGETEHEFFGYNEADIVHRIRY
tara:strand:- start:243 stop:491 length:249 start_codon:yes stop_codon:yes gene_type:complete